jgi:hypothetical protein
MCLFLFGMDKASIDAGGASYHCISTSLRENPRKAGLLTSISSGRFRTVRIGIHYRALGISVPGVQWFWIGSHAAYDKLLS